LPVYKNVELENPYVAHVNSQTSVTQSFVPLCAELSSVKLTVETAQGSGQDKLTFSLLDDAQKVVAAESFVISDLQVRETIQLPVAYTVPAGSSSLWLQLTVEGAQSAEVGLLGRSGGQKYPAGELTFNQQVQDADLYFRYTCSNK
jgi:hypothetical protein